MLQEPPRISAVVCTRNRAESLRATLESLVRQTVPADRYEIVVVDNGSTDHTQGVISSFGGHARLRAVSESNVGLSNARNTGWVHAASDIVAYIDDDAVASSDWLNNIVDTFDKLGSDVSVVGGKVLPAWEVPPPDWLLKEHEDVLSILDRGNVPRFLRPSEWLVGTNVAYRKSAIRELGGFHPDLGRKDTDNGLHEEAFLNEKIRRSGKAMFYHPSIVVQHVVQADRMRKDWLLSAAFAEGRDAAKVDVLLHENDDASFFHDDIVAFNDRLIDTLKREGMTFDAAFRTMKWLGYASAMLAMRQPYRRYHVLSEKNETLRETVDQLRQENRRLQERSSKFRAEIDVMNQAKQHDQERTSQRFVHLQQLVEALENQRALTAHIDALIKKTKEDARMKSDYEHMVESLRIERSDLMRRNAFHEKEMRSYSYRVGRAATWLPRKVMAVFRAIYG